MGTRHWEEPDCSAYLAPTQAQGQAESPCSTKEGPVLLRFRREEGSGFGSGGRWDGKEIEEISLLCVQIYCSLLSCPYIFHVIFYPVGFSCSALLSLLISASLFSAPPPSMFPLSSPLLPSFSAGGSASVIEGSFSFHSVGDKF